MRHLYFTKICDIMTISVTITLHQANVFNCDNFTDHFLFGVSRDFSHMGGFFLLDKKRETNLNLNQVSNLSKPETLQVRSGRQSPAI